MVISGPCEHGGGGEQEGGERPDQRRRVVRDRSLRLSLRGVEAHAGTAQQFERRIAADADEDIVVRDDHRLLRAFDRAGELDIPGSDSDRRPVHEEVEPAIARELLEACAVLRLDARQVAAAGRDRHGVALLVREREGRLDGAVAAADDEDAPAAVGLRVEEA